MSYMWSREGLKMLVTDGRTDCSTISQGDMQEMLLHLKMDLYLEMTTMILYTCRLRNPADFPTPQLFAVVSPELDVNHIGFRDQVGWQRIARSLPQQ